MWQPMPHLRHLVEVETMRHCVVCVSYLAPPRWGRRLTSIAARMRGIRRLTEWRIGQMQRVLYPEHVYYKQYERIYRTANVSVSVISLPA
jgi:hypothetical protein